MYDIDYYDNYNYDYYPVDFSSSYVWLNRGKRKRSRLGRRKGYSLGSGKDVDFYEYSDVLPLKRKRKRYYYGCVLK